MREWQQAAAAALIRSPAWIYRDFTHVGGGKMPDAKTMGRWGVALGRAVLKQFTRMVRIAHDNGVTAGRRMRVDTTVVETNIHHPTDSTLLGDRAIRGADGAVAIATQNSDVSSRPGHDQIRRARR
jgi:hypothetical protein